jgi:hypothetical protein
VAKKKKRSSKKAKTSKRMVGPRAIVKAINAHTKAVKRLKKKADPSLQKKIERHLKNLGFAKAMSEDQCDTFAPA